MRNRGPKDWLILVAVILFVCAFFASRDWLFFNSNDTFSWTIAGLAAFAASFWEWRR